MQVDASHGTLPHRMILQKNPKQDNGLYVQPPVTSQPREKLSSEVVVKEPKDNNVASTESSVESVSTPTLPEITDNLDEESSTYRENMAYCVKTKPYYSINAKLNQREKVPVAPINTSANKYVHKVYSESGSGVDEVAALSVIDEPIAPIVEDIKPPATVWDANFKFLGTSAPSGRTTTTTTTTTSQTYNKSSVICLICGKQLSNQYNLRVHMETHSNSSYSCAACSHVSRSRDALRKHVSYRHPVASPQKRPRYSTPKP